MRAWCPSAGSPDQVSHETAESEGLRRSRNVLAANLLMKHRDRAEYAAVATPANVETR